MQSRLSGYNFPQRLEYELEARKVDAKLRTVIGSLLKLISICNALLDRILRAQQANVESIHYLRVVSDTWSGASHYLLHTIDVTSRTLEDWNDISLKPDYIHSYDGMKTRSNLRENSVMELTSECLVPFGGCGRN